MLLGGEEWTMTRWLKKRRVQSGPSHTDMDIHTSNIRFITAQKVLLKNYMWILLFKEIFFSKCAWEYVSGAKERDGENMGLANGHSLKNGRKEIISSITLLMWELRRKAGESHLLLGAGVLWLRPFTHVRVQKAYWTCGGWCLCEKTDLWSE